MARYDPNQLVLVAKDKYTRICKKCLIEKPIGDFTKQRTQGRMHHHWTCKVCRRKTERVCKGCGIKKAIENFQERKTNRGTYRRSICFDCASPVDRVCKECGVKRPIEEYDSTTRSGVTYHRLTCRKCRQPETTRKARERRNRKCLFERRLYSRKKGIYDRYGISLERFDQMREEQGYKCAICERPEKNIREYKRALNIDHCHRTGKVRGLLCQKCNMMLGLARDNELILRSAIAYLECHEHGELLN